MRTVMSSSSCRALPLRGLRAALLLLALALASVGAGAQNLKFGSLAPEGSPWDTALRRTAAEWERLSDGAIDMAIFAGGVVGDGPDMMRKIRIGQLDAAAVAAPSLATIYPGALALGMPFLFHNQEELTYVTQQLRPLIEEEFERRGFKVLMWTAAGWVYFFSRDPSPAPDDLQRQKLWVSETDAAIVAAWREIGFRIVELSATEVTLGLQTGLIDAVLTSPLIAASFQWFGITDNMNGLPIAPFYGALVISTRSWRRLPAELRPQLLEAAKAAEQAATDEVLAADKAAVEIMRRFGLTIQQTSAEQAAAWRVLQRGFQPLVGPVVDERAFQVVTGSLADYRAGRAAAP